MIESSINIGLFVLLVLTGIAIIRVRRLFGVVVFSGVFSLLSALLFVSLDAVDVAFTEAAVGAGMSTVLMLTTIAMTPRVEAKPRRSGVLPFFVVAITGAALIYGTLDMPAFGSADAPAQTHVAPDYLERSVDEIDVPNVVTSILASYRGFDTLGETAVVFTAGIAVLFLLSGLGLRSDEILQLIRPRRAPHHLILRVVSKSLIPMIILFGLYVQFHGDFSPGGGFQAGVIVAAAFIIYGIVFSLDAVQRVLPVWVVHRVMALGVLIYAGTGVLSVLQGYAFLDYNAFDPGHPSHGQHNGILAVEAGVGITVTGVMITIFYAFAARLPRIKDEDW